LAQPIEIFSETQPTPTHPARAIQPAEATPTMCFFGGLEPCSLVLLLVVTVSCKKFCQQSFLPKMLILRHIAQPAPASVISPGAQRQL
jgi:hypothetical protein